MNTERKEAADKVIQSHALVSMGAGLVPVPLLDIAAVTAIQVDLLHKLSHLFEIEYAENSSKGMIIALTGGTVARFGASMLKFVPVIGSIFGGASMAAMSAASTYAVGQVFTKHFISGGTLSDFDPMKSIKSYEEAFAKGVKETFTSPKVETNTEKNDAILAQLERLAGLHKKKVLSDKEFEKMKKKLMDGK